MSILTFIRGKNKFSAHDIHRLLKKIDHIIEANPDQKNNLKILKDNISSINEKYEKIKNKEINKLGIIGLSVTIGGGIGTAVKPGIGTAIGISSGVVVGGCIIIGIVLHDRYQKKKCEDLLTKIKKEINAQLPQEKISTSHQSMFQVKKASKQEDPGFLEIRTPAYQGK